MDHEGAEFWKLAVQRLYATYVEPRPACWVAIFARLDLGHWRQLLDFGGGVRHFLFLQDFSGPLKVR